MCNDYERHIEWAAYEAALARAHLGGSDSDGPDALLPVADVRVNDISPVIAARGNGVALVPMRWGFAPPRPGAPPVFNFRSEGRDFTRSNRCLIPASAFFEFTGKSSPKTKWRFELVGSPLFAVAGLWREDARGPAFTMLTTAPGEDVAPYHDRQIVIVEPGRWAEWLYLAEPDPSLVAPLPPRSLGVSIARRGKDPIPREIEQRHELRS